MINILRALVATQDYAYCAYIATGLRYFHHCINYGAVLAIIILSTLPYKFTTGLSSPHFALTLPSTPQLDPLQCVTQRSYS